MRLAIGDIPGAPLPLLLELPEEAEEEAPEEAAVPDGAEVTVPVPPAACEIREAQVPVMAAAEVRVADPPKLQALLPLPAAVCSE